MNINKSDETANELRTQIIQRCHDILQRNILQLVAVQTITNVTNSEKDSIPFTPLQTHFYDFDFEKGILIDTCCKYIAQISKTYTPTISHTFVLCQKKNQMFSEKHG